eukprot:CAMPEP_0194312070 /NCGR_PEP_ID=MMETSP0171-20130528/8997_1 /TAXON_ID=218684 /ORGANISM="Corethron pennatum, Strain L29A3" /LENGTH=232 /DNA_ID=CAMNT_0039066435 /DNA_START=171 /DNA_END=869 /DNA_ORIENTATION=-
MGAPPPGRAEEERRKNTREKIIEALEQTKGSLHDLLARMAVPVPDEDHRRAVAQRCAPPGGGGDGDGNGCDDEDPELLDGEAVKQLSAQREKIRAMREKVRRRRVAAIARATDVVRREIDSHSLKISAIEIDEASAAVENEVGDGNQSTLDEPIANVEGKFEKLNESLNKLEKEMKAKTNVFRKTVTAVESAIDRPETYIDKAMRGSGEKPSSAEGRSADAGDLFVQLVEKR